jgi:enterochelin esterase family protein
VNDTVYVRDPHSFHGRVEMRPFESALLKGNRPGDPHVREVPVYLPPAALEDPGKRFGVVFILAGFTGRGHKYLDCDPWRPGVVARYDRAVAAGEAAPAILVLPDCFTSFGGSQYVNSGFLGPYEDHLISELVPWVDGLYPVRRGRRAVVGKSSGGFGALRLAMRHPDVFPVAASISGDCWFEACLAADFPNCLKGLIPYGGDPAKFLEAFLLEPDLSGFKHAVINTLAMAAAYSPNPDSALGFDLPFDLETGARRQDVWQRWLEFDPLVCCETHAESLRRLELLHLECGLVDEFHLQWGLRQLAAKLRGLNVAFDHEEHAGGHMGIDRRYNALLPKLIAALGPAPRQR